MPNPVALQEPPGLGGCPPGMARVEGAAGQAVCVDRWEAHLVELGDDGAARAWSPYFNPGRRRVLARSVPGAVPQGYISEVQAAAACDAAGKRLCAADEWLLACRGAARNTYPYGPSRRPGVCNDAREKHAAIEYFGAGDREVFRKLTHPCISQQPDSLARTGSHPGCVTADGVEDLMGNLHEWVADPRGTFLGGFFSDTVRNGPGCLYRTSAHNASYFDYSTGFRCCADAP